MLIVKIIAFEGEGCSWTPEELGYDPNLYWKVGTIIEVPERVFSETRQRDEDGYDIYRIHRIELNSDGVGTAKMTYQYSTPF